MFFQALRTRPGQSPAPQTTGGVHLDPASDGATQFEQLVCGTHLAVLQGIALVSCFNALQTGRSLRSPLALRNFVPREPSATAVLRHCTGEMSIEPNVLDAADAFYSVLPHIEEEIVLFCDDLTEFGVAQAMVYNAQRLASVTRLLVGRAATAVQALEAVIARVLPAQYTLNTKLLLKLLQDVRQGGTPCLDAHGNCFLPELPQRRPAPRRAMACPCILEHQGRTLNAVVKDIATGGLGLDGAPGLVPGKVILAELPGGRCLAGVVTWASGNRGGVKFGKPLAVDDPLLVN